MDPMTCSCVTQRPPKKDLKILQQQWSPPKKNFFLLDKDKPVCTVPKAFCQIGKKGPLWRNIMSMGVLLKICLTFIVFDVVKGFFPSASSSSSTPQIKRVSAGPIDVSSLGCGTWSWGNRLLFNYDPSQDEEIYKAYREIRNAGVTLFDTAGRSVRPCVTHNI